MMVHVRLGDSLIVAQIRKSNLPSQKLTTSSKDGEDHSTEGEDITANRSEEDHARVTHCVDFRMAKLELDQ